MLDTMRSMEASHPCVGDANPLVGEGVSVEWTLISSVVLSVDEVKKGMSSDDVDQSKSPSTVDQSKNPSTEENPSEDSNSEKK